jgi:membrane-bound lytic murein transglycosylase B
MGRFTLDVGRTGGSDYMARSAVLLVLVAIFTAFLIPHLLLSHAHAQGSSSPNETIPHDEQAFQQWLQALIAEARAAGIREDIIQRALVPVKPIPQVVTSDRSQAEFVETLDQYLEKRVTAWRINTGRQRLRENRELLEEVSAAYGVQPRFIVAFWGVETNFGSFTGGTEVVRALVTLAYDPRRSAYFRNELMSALQILNEGHIGLEDMKGSWAGAMGQSQFMPSSFMQYAVDFDGDGRRDIWNSKADVFASIANYLASHGWRNDQTWGREVVLPADYHANADRWQQPEATHSCSVLRRHTVQKTLPEWQAAGIRNLDGSALPTVDFKASIILPDGQGGRAFVTYENFRTILRYNCANNYALSVGYLADSFIGH